MSNIRTLVFDLDGTLLGSAGSLSDYTVSVLEKCRDAGLRVCYATARSEFASRRFTSVFPPDVMISSAGARATAGGKVIYRAAIDADRASCIGRTIAFAPGVRIVTAETDGGYFVSYDPYEENAGGEDYRNAVYHDFKSGRIPFDVYKFSVQFYDSSGAARLAAELPELAVNGYEGELWYRFAHRDATKWKALSAVSACLGMPAGQMVAFGDDGIDIEMLIECGVGVAPENAAERVRLAADFVCGSNDRDGPARWVMENVPGLAQAGR